MTIQEFETELKKIDSHLAVRPNPPHKVFPELEKVASVTYQGADLFTIPNFNIYDEPSDSYGIISPIGGEKFIPHRTRPEALMMAMTAVERLNTSKEYRDLILGQGAYSDAALRSKDPEPQVELVEDVPIEIKEVGSEEQISHVEEKRKRGRPKKHENTLPK